jgi:hypothetical protein
MGNVSHIRTIHYIDLSALTKENRIYPVDVIKSKLQTDSLDPKKAQYKGMLDCAAKTWRAQGWKGFTGGLTPTLIRSVPQVYCVGHAEYIVDPPSQMEPPSLHSSWL